MVGVTAPSFFHYVVKLDVFVNTSEGSRILVKKGKKEIFEEIILKEKEKRERDTRHQDVRHDTDDTNRDATLCTKNQFLFSSSSKHFLALALIDSARTVANYGSGFNTP